MTDAARLFKNTVSSNYTGRDRYDLIIIGSGISGLSTGCMWLKNTNNKKTLIVEKNPYTGGYVTSFVRGGYVFETTQLTPDVVNILDYLGIDIRLKPYTGTFMRRIVVRDDGIDEYRIPTGADNFTEYLCSVFPDDAAKIKRLMDYSVSMFQQVRKLKVIPTLMDKLATPFLAPKVIANLNRTYTGLLDRFGIKNPALREVLETFSAFAGVPSSMSSAVLTAGAMLSSMTRCFRPYGFYDELPAKMAILFQELGGELRLKAEVEKIVVEDGKVKGVKIRGDDGTISAERVVTTVDPMLAMRTLVGENNLPSEFVSRLDRIIMSPSSLNISLGLDEDIDLKSMDLDYPYNVVSTGLGTTEKLFEGYLQGKEAFTEKCFHSAVVCPSLTTGMKNTVIIRGVPFGINRWKEWRENDRRRYDEEKERWSAFFTGIIEKYFVPRLGKHIRVKDISTPATYARYSGSPTGSIYDMAALVTQFGPKRLPMVTPIKNLFQPKFAHGIYGGMMNGVQVVDMMLNRSFNGGNSLFAPGEQG